MSDDIDDDELLIIVLGAVIAVLVLGGGLAGFCFYKRYKSKFNTYLTYEERNFCNLSLQE